MVVWHKPSEKLPEDGQDCVLMGQSLYGPIKWWAKESKWLDLFATPEAGAMVDPEHVELWAAWDDIKPKEGEE